jgi:NitT/TauT family transport system permease protein
MRVWLVNHPAVARTIILVALVGLLEIICDAGMVRPTTLIAPSQMAVALAIILLSGKFNSQIWSTVSNVGAAMLISVVSGFVIGVLIHAVPRVRQAVQPLLASSYAIPGFIFYVPLLGVFGLNDAPLISVGCILAIPSMILATFNGLDRIPVVLLRYSRVCHLSSVQTMLSVKLPSTIPHLFSGIRLCLAYAFIGVIASEFILSDRGVGYSIAYAYHDFDMRTMYALMLLIILLVTGVNAGLQKWENRIMAKRSRQ